MHQSTLDTLANHYANGVLDYSMLEKFLKEKNKVEEVVRIAEENVPLEQKRSVIELGYFSTEIN